MNSGFAAASLQLGGGGGGSCRRNNLCFAAHCLACPPTSLWGWGVGLPAGANAWYHDNATFCALPNCLGMHVTLALGWFFFPSFFSLFFPGAMHHRHWYGVDIPMTVYRYEDLVENPMFVLEKALKSSGLWAKCGSARGFLILRVLLCATCMLGPRDPAAAAVNRNLPQPLVRPIFQFLLPASCRGSF